MVAFVLIGRASHHEDDALTGFLRTVWPFAAGLAAGWVVAVLSRRPALAVATGVVLGVTTALVGLALRAVSGQGVAWSFLVVAVVVLTLFLAGWRGVATALAARPRRL